MNKISIKFDGCFLSSSGRLGARILGLKIKAHLPSSHRWMYKGFKKKLRYSSHSCKKAPGAQCDGICCPGKLLHRKTMGCASSCRSPDRPYKRTKAKTNVLAYLFGRVMQVYCFTTVYPLLRRVWVRCLGARARSTQAEVLNGETNPKFVTV